MYLATYRDGPYVKTIGKYQTIAAALKAAIAHQDKTGEPTHISFRSDHAIKS